nr:MAG TPA: hypothetical protein [Caudoviricetes sp.]
MQKPVRRDGRAKIEDGDAAGGFSTNRAGRAEPACISQSRHPRGRADCITNDVGNRKK